MEHHEFDWALEKAMEHAAELLKHANEEAAKKEREIRENNDLPAETKGEKLARVAEMQGMTAETGSKMLCGLAGAMASSRKMQDLIQHIRKE